MPHVTVSQAMQMALEEHRAGRLEQAENIYRQVLQHAPDNSDAMHLLGVVCHLRGLTEEAMNLIRQSIAANPQAGQYHFNLGEVYRSMGKTADAIECYRKAIAASPELPDPYNNLGNLLRQQGRLDEAIQCYRRLIELRPEYAAAHNNMANALNDKGQREEAIAAYRKAIALLPTYAAAWNNLGGSLQKEGRLDEALEVCRKAIELRPEYANAYHNVGSILHDQGRPEEAIANYQKSLELDPNRADTYNNLGISLKYLYRFREALAYYEKSLQLKPNIPYAFNNLGNVLCDLGRIDPALDAYRSALRIFPRFAEAGSNLLLTLHYHPDVTPQAIFEEHRKWNEQFAVPLADQIQPLSNTPDPQRPLRIGYVSADFRDHAAAFFIEPMLGAHDHRQFTIIAYSNVGRSDFMTTRMQTLCDDWHDISALTDEKAAEQVRRDEIDILVDLGGHTSGGRMLLFARKPAPVQVTFLGYPDTTGMTCIDYRITDAALDPPGMTENLHSEKLLRLPIAFVYRPPDNAPEVGDLPADSTGQITFGWLGNFSKLNPRVFELWAKVLAAVPNSRLLLKAAAFGDPEICGQVAADFAQHGIAADRLVFEGWGQFVAFLDVYRRIDIGLDTFPFDGHTTTCHSLWMGIPVPALIGPVHISRRGMLLLDAVGLADLAAATPAEYVQKTAALAGDVSRLRELRKTLRQQVRDSVIMDAAAFTRNLEQAYRDIWRRWCATVSVPADSRT